MKLQITPKRIFLWYLHNGVTLTKDNLAKRNWQGSLKCCSCSSLETIQHLFFCYFSRFIWNTIHITFGIQPPSSIANMFGPWLNSFRPKLIKNRILVGAAAICWTIWLNRHDMVFKGGKSNTF